MLGGGFPRRHRHNGRPSRASTRAGGVAMMQEMQAQPRLLVVDDSKDTTELLATLARAWGYQVAEVAISAIRRR